MGPPAETRALIIQATIRLIQRIGVGSLTTRLIAAEAEISEGTLFNHFAKKDDLVFTVIVESVPRFEPPSIEAGVGSVQENLAVVVRAALRFYEGVVPIVLGLFADTSLLSRHISAVRNRYGGPQYMVEYFVAYVQAEQECGRIDERVKATSITSALLGACFQWVFVARLSGQPLWAEMPEDEFVDGLLGVLAFGLHPRSTT